MMSTELMAATLPRGNFRAKIFSVLPELGDPDPYEEVDNFIDITLAVFELYATGEDNTRISFDNMTDDEKRIAADYVLHMPLYIPELSWERRRMDERAVDVHKGLVFLRTEILPEFLQAISDDDDFEDLVDQNNSYHLDYETEFIRQMQYYGYGSPEVHEYWVRALESEAYQKTCDEWDLTD